MVTTSSPILTSGWIPRVLIAEDTVSAIEPLIQLAHDRRLDLEVDHCTSPGSAVSKMVNTPSYQLIISGARLAERNHCFFFNSAQVLGSSVPFVVTASASEKMPAGRILDRGAFDLLTRPLNPEQAVRTIRLALWQSRLKAYLARREQVVEAYRQHMATYPGDWRGDEAFQHVLSIIQSTLASAHMTLQAVEQSMQWLSTLASQTESHARQQAFERLNMLSA